MCVQNFHDCEGYYTILSLHTIFLAITLMSSFTFAQNEPEFVGVVDGANITTQMRYISHGVPKIIVRDLDEVDIYNLDLTLYTSFSLPDVDFNTGPLFITTSLFDCDSTQLEYMNSGGTSDSSFTRIYREDGNILLDIPYGYFFGTNLTGLEVSISSGEDGSYGLFRAGFPNNEVVLYRFCGQLPQPLARESNGNLITGIIEQESNNGFDT